MIISSVYLIIPSSALYYATNVYKTAMECSSCMALYLMFMIYYFLFVGVRHILLCMMLPCIKKPQRLVDVSNIVYVVVDLFYVVVLTVWGGICIFSDEAITCKDSAIIDLMNWWILSMVCLLYGLIYSLLLCIGLASLPFILIFWCYYLNQVRNV